MFKFKTSTVDIIAIFTSHIHYNTDNCVNALFMQNRTFGIDFKLKALTCLSAYFFFVNQASSFPPALQLHHQHLLSCIFTIPPQH